MAKQISLKFSFRPYIISHWLNLSKIKTKKPFVRDKFELKFDDKMKISIEFFYPIFNYLSGAL